MLRDESQFLVAWMVASFKTWIDENKIFYLHFMHMFEIKSVFKEYRTKTMKYDWIMNQNFNIIYKFSDKVHSEWKI